MDKQPNNTTIPSPSGSATSSALDVQKNQTARPVGGTRWNPAFYKKLKAADSQGCPRGNAPAPGM